ncbi:unnamed protein product, partial [Notodromas monacha]
IAKAVRSSHPLLFAELDLPLTEDQWCKAEFVNANALADCATHFSEFGLDKLLARRELVWKLRETTVWKGFVVRVHGGPFGILPFSVPSALAGLAAVKSGMSRDGVRETIALEKVACNFLLENPQETIKHLERKGSHLPKKPRACHPFHGTQTIADFTQAIRLIKSHEVSCVRGTASRGVTHGLFFNARNSEAVCADLSLQTCRMEQAVSRDLKKWHERAVVENWAAFAFKVATIKCPLVFVD